ncbi:hypothetical protein [Dongshaea marina]|nr:hypothetical protein [Dongshaea marina]
MVKSCQLQYKLNLQTGKYYLSLLSGHAPKLYTPPKVLNKHSGRYLPAAL